MEDEPIVFEHIATQNKKGKEISEVEFTSFVAGIAARLIEEEGDKILSTIRLLSFDTPCLISKERVYIVSYKMYPDYSILAEGEKLEALSLAKVIDKKPISYPLSLASITEEPSKRVAGASYLVRKGQIEEI